MTDERLPENTVIYGDNCSRRQQTDRPPVSVSPYSSLKNLKLFCFLAANFAD